MSLSIFLDKIIHLALPSKCLCCGLIVEAQGAICGQCWSEITFLKGSSCQKCAQPFEYSVPDGTICGTCEKDKPAYDHSISVLKYDEHSKRLITRFKYSDQIQSTPAYAKWMQNAGKELLEKTDIILPVPLHWRRRISRRYNQAGLLGNIIAKNTNLPIKHGLLFRNLNNTPQASLSMNKRKKNVTSAFTVNEKYKAEISGANILLIDDVMTTGATLNACTKTLKKAGAKEVYTLTLAKRVLE